jgi:predicted exporter
MPSGEEAELAAISRQLIDSKLSRSMVLSIGGGEGRVEVAAALAEFLAAQPGVASVRAGMRDEQLEALHDLYFERIAYFASDRPEDEIPLMLAEEALQTRARKLRETLSSPSAALFTRLAASDPLGLFPDLLQRFRGSQSGLGLQGGQFVSADGRHAFVFLETRASPFDSPKQSALLSALAERFQELDREHGGGHVLEQSGVNRLALATERSMRRDMRFISIFSFVGVSALFLLFFRSLRSLLIAIHPPLFGISFATACGALAFDTLSGVTVAFGVALIGVAIDYPIHLINHHGLVGSRQGGAGVLARLRPSLTLGAATTITSFLGLTLTTFPGIGEMGMFAALGIAAALGATLYALPLFLDSLPKPAPAQRAIAEGLGRGLERVSRRPALLAIGPVLAVAIAAIGLPRLVWEDDPAALTSLDPELRAEDRRVRERVSEFDPGRFVIARAASAEEAIALNDEVHLRLAKAIERGHLEGRRSLHDVLWSESLQRRNLEQLRAEPRLAERIDASFQHEGFRPDAFSAFTEGLAPRGDFPEPLGIEDLAGSPLESLASSMLVDLGDAYGAITYLRGVRDPEGIRALLEGLSGASYFDQQALLHEIYTGYRNATLVVIALGSILVFAVLWLRYRDLRVAFAAFMPSVLVAFATFGLFALLGMSINLLGLIGLILVMGMGVDYGIFVVDSTRDTEHLGATLASLLLSCLTTLLVFGVLAFSIHPALRSIGLTSGVGIVMAFLLAPSALLLCRDRPGEAR